MGAIMVGYLTVIFSCQLAGELFVAALKLPVPGPVIGMALLFVGLLIHGSIPDALGNTANILITNLSLLFIPAGVGVMLHVKLIGRDWLPISVALVVSTALTIAITATVMVWLTPRPAKTNGRNRGEGE
jgi:holin-like protein